ncbi:hypothetical protein MOQ11_00365 [Stenotrophomonas maltophilia]|uniref:hypothetical protein n=1 Tax=Stenotrophomonas maltophilia TaxID=40324 RepID=UPI001F52DA0C|nr:hypothetical protein [Stenotrophomonas maltophilia]MCI1130332.1 hypothetical protein [Stenotrophomonas maltophilia]
MKKSKSKTRRLSALRYFVAVHQDSLMDAFALGFIAPRSGGLEGESVVTPAAVVNAKGGLAWGDVVLLEVAPPSQGGAVIALSQPLLLADVIGCWTRTADVAIEIDARIETFDDTVPGMVKIAADPVLFPPQVVASQDALPLGLDVGSLQPDAPTVADNRRDAIALEKIAGALSMLRSRAKTGALDFDLLEHLLAMSSSEERARDSAVLRLASHVYRILRPGQIETGDERMFVQAAVGLRDAFPKQGLDPVAFVESLGDSEGTAPFLETLRKVLDNRIELSDSRLDDSGMVGQRALLVFLLAPRADELERWLRARPVGPVVAALASMLSGIYCGLGSISREVKGPTPDAMLAVVQAASSILDVLPPQVRVVRAWDANAAVRECIVIEDRELLVQTKQPPKLMTLLLAAASDAGLEALVDHETGRCFVLVDQSATLIDLEIAISDFRVSSDQVARLVFRGRGPRRGLPSKEMLTALLDESLRPVVCTVDTSGSILLAVELDNPTSLSKGITELMRVAGSLGLIQEAAVKKKKAKRTQVSS